MKKWIACLSFGIMSTEHTKRKAGYFHGITGSEKCKENINYSKAVSIVEKVKKKINANNNFDMSIDYMLIHIWEEFNG